ncbi:hypothetical protein BC830DRAFT_1114803 [Chytriomyces sp. MP71]|nr:hypothetical protein BC830DRAFT_1114803 [Chytriomyces sp. MP71]
MNNKHTKWEDCLRSIPPLHRQAKLPAGRYAGCTCQDHKGYAYPHSKRTVLSISCKRQPCRR